MGCELRPFDLDAGIAGTHPATTITLAHTLRSHWGCRSLIQKGAIAITVPSRSISRFVRGHGPYLWLILIAALTTYFGLRNIPEIKRISTLVSTADRSSMFTILMIELCILALVALTYQSLLSNLGHYVRFRSLVAVHLQRVVVGTISPIGGPSSILIFIHSMRQRNVRPADALLAISIKSVLGNLAFLVLLIPILFMQEPSRALILSSVGLIGLIAVTCLLLGLALRKRKPPAFITSRLPRRGLRMLAQTRQHHIAFGSLIGPFGYLLATKLCGALILLMALRAVGIQSDLQVPLIAYFVGMVFLMVAPVFQGIGFVEVGMALALQRLGVPPAAAIGATLLTRVAELWLPLCAGLIFQALSTTRHRRLDPPLVQAPV